jgi:hypothetical protein
MSLIQAPHRKPPGGRCRAVLRSAIALNIPSRNFCVSVYIHLQTPTFPHFKSFSLISCLQKLTGTLYNVYSRSIFFTKARSFGKTLAQYLHFLPLVMMLLYRTTISSSWVLYKISTLVRCSLISIQILELRGDGINVAWDGRYGLLVIVPKNIAVCGLCGHHDKDFDGPDLRVGLVSVHAQMSCPKLNVTTPVDEVVSKIVYYTVHPLIWLMGHGSHTTGLPIVARARN